MGTWAAGLITQGPVWLGYHLFSWIYSTRVLRHKAAVTPYPRIRKLLLEKSGIPVGEGTEIGFGSVILGISRNPPSVTFGRRVAVGPYVIFVASSYPDNSRLAGHPEVARMIRKTGPITVEDDAWIGAGAVIFPDVHLGRGCIVAAGAVGRDSVAAGTIVGGVPARTIRTLESES
jgi:maltose O-acetyltransferase